MAGRRFFSPGGRGRATWLRSKESFTAGCTSPTTRSLVAIRLAKVMASKKCQHNLSPPAKELARRLIENTRRLPKSLAPALRNHLFDVVHGQLSPNASFGGDKKEQAEKGCELCGEDVSESLSHYFPCVGLQRLRFAIWSAPPWRKKGRPPPS